MALFSPAVCKLFDLDPLPGNISRDFIFEIAIRVVKIQFKRTSLRIAVVT